MKIFELQHLVLPQFISVVESSLRKIINKKKPILLGEILDYLLKRKYILKNEFHLWSGIRHIRNSIVHYNSHATVTNTYRFNSSLIIELKENKPIESKNLFQDFELMNWMAINIKKILLNISNKK